MDDEVKPLPLAQAIEDNPKGHPGASNVKMEPSSSSSVDDDGKNGTVKQEEGTGSTLPEVGNESADDDEEEAEDEEEDAVVEETHLPVTSLYKEPAYAQLCSFFNLYSSLLSMKPMAFTKLEKMFTTLYNGEADKDLIDLHVTMMRKIYLKSARTDKWESSLLKFCSICPSLEMELRQLQRYGYCELPMASKLSIARALCESQFDCNVKFKENVFNTYTAQEMRLAPIGSDMLGQSYFYQQDYDLNMRVYSGEPDDGAGTTWQLRASSQHELMFLICELQSPDFGKQREIKSEESKLEDGVEKEKPALECELDNKVVVSVCDKWSVYWDLFKDSSVLNKFKKKLEKEKRRKDMAQQEAVESLQEQGTDESKEEGDASNETTECPPPQEDADDFDPTPFLYDDRRILPRRSARMNAMVNLKSFTASPAKREKKETAVATREGASSSAGKLKPATKVKSPSRSDSDAESSDDEKEEESDEEEEGGESDEDENANSSDDDFDPDSPARANTVRGYGGLPEKKRPKKRDDGKVLKKKKRGRRAKKAKRGTKPAMCFDIGRLKKQQKESAVSTVESSSSDDEGNDQGEEKLKERKKATEKSLCMHCNGSKRPDLLLLCDLCDDPWHTYCLNPKLWYVPDGDWFCPKCEHQRLIERLSFALAKLREQSKAREEDEAKRKKEVADRLKKEMDWIGSQISLTNIIPNNRDTPPMASSSEDNDVEDGQRKSKKRAMRKVMTKGTRQKLAHQQFERFYGPIVTIAEGRSRRTVKKVDYNFEAYEEQLKEAMVDDGSNARTNDSPGPSGLGKGKDMANIINADLKRRESIDEENRNDDMLPARPPSSSRLALPPSKKPTNAAQSKKRKRKRKKLTDLDIDNATESSSTDAEYNAMSDECRQEEDPDPSEDEYLPREFQKRGPRGPIGPTRSDEEFIDDDSLDSEDYEVSSSQRKRHKVRNVGKKKGRKRKANQYNSDDVTEDSAEDDYQGESNESYRVGKRKKGRLSAGVAVPPHRKPKWVPKAASTSGEDEDELEAPSDESEELERTETGRPLRRAAVQMKQKIREIEDLDHELAEELDEGVEDNKEGEPANGGGISQKPAGARPVGARSEQGLRKRKIVSEDEEEAKEFQPDDEEEESSEDEDEPDKEGSEKGDDSHEPPGTSKMVATPNFATSVKTERPGNHSVNNTMSGTTKDDGRSEQMGHEDPVEHHSSAAADAGRVVCRNALGGGDSVNTYKSEIGKKPTEADVSIEHRSAAATLPPPQLPTSHGADRKPTTSAPKRTPSQRSLVPANPSSLNLPIMPAAAQNLTLAPMRPIMNQTNTAGISASPAFHTFPPAPAPPYFVPNSAIPPVSSGAAHYPGGLPRTDAPMTRPQLSHYAYHNSVAIQPQPFFPNIGTYGGNQPMSGEPQFVIDPRTGQLVDANSLGQALAGAMNPEDL